MPSRQFGLTFGKAGVFSKLSKQYLVFTVHRDGENFIFSIVDTIYGVCDAIMRPFEKCSAAK